MSSEEKIQELTQHLGNALQRVEALENAMGALVMLGLRQLPNDQRARFGDALAAFAATAEKHGDMATATLLTEVHSAAAQASGG
jgi:lauroyl/myristoyl acyltransferase